MSFAHPPMTPLEELLKEMLEKRPDMQEQIPDAEMLTAYIAWMSETYGEQYRPRLSPEDIPVPVARSDQRLLADKIMKQAPDARLLSRFSAGFALQSEQWSISADYDVSMSRMLRYMPGQWHTSEYFEIYCAPAGPCPIHFTREALTLSAGSILIVAPGVVHASPCFAEDAILYSFMVRSSTFDRVFFHQLPEHSLLADFFRRALSGENDASWLRFETEQDPELDSLLARIEAQSHEDEPYSGQLMNTLLTLFFILLLKNHEHTARLPRSGSFYWKHEYSAILSYIQQNFAAAGIDDVARHFHYSTRQISRVVKESLHLTYAELIQKLRMEQAMRLLSRGTLPIAEIGASVGYADNSSFYRAFRTYYGKTPGECRPSEPS